MGNVYTSQEEYGEAAEAYRRAINRDRDYPWAYNNLALVVNRQGDEQQAIELYQEAIERHTAPGDASISWNNLGDVYEALGRYPDAERAYQQAIDLNPRYARPWKSLGCQGRDEQGAGRSQ